MARAIKVGRGATPNRLKQPLNPSVRGTPKQSGHEDKGLTRPTTPSEGRGQHRGGGRGGRVSDRKR